MMDKPKKSKLWIMVGVPGSGKSHWIKTHRDYFSGSLAVASRDTIRFTKLKEGDEYFSKEKEVFKTFVDHIKAGLEYFDNTIADATHLNDRSRSKLLRALGDSLKDVEVNAIVIDSCLAKCLEQNSWRSERELVPETALRNMFNNFTMPTLEEGFDSIYVYRKNGDKVVYEIIKRGD